MNDVSNGGVVQLLQVKECSGSFSVGLERIQFFSALGNVLTFLFLWLRTWHKALKCHVLSIVTASHLVRTVSSFRR